MENAHSYSDCLGTCPSPGFYPIMDSIGSLPRSLGRIVRSYREFLSSRYTCSWHFQRESFSCHPVTLSKKKLPGRFWTETFHLLLPLCLLTLKWEQGRHFSPSRHGKRARVARRTWSLVLPFLQSPRALLSLHLQLALCALEDPGRGESSVDPQPLINLSPALSHFTARAAAPWLSGRCLIKWQEAGVDLLSQSSWEEREDGGGWGLGWELQGEMRRRQSLELWGFGWRHLQVTYTDRLKIHCSLEMCIYNMVIWRGLRETVPSVQGCFRP